jgi:6-phosphogluconolactonase
LNDQFSYGKDPCYISIEQTGQFAFVDNYTSGSVAMFPIQADGQLSPAREVIQHLGSSAHPERQTGPHAHCILPDPTNRFAIDPSGTFLLVANQKTNSIVTFKIDTESGQLFKTGHEVQLSMPVCLKFAYLE